MSREQDLTVRSEREQSQNQKKNQEQSQQLELCPVRNSVFFQSKEIWIYLVVGVLT